MFLGSQNSERRRSSDIWIASWSLLPFMTFRRSRTTFLPNISSTKVIDSPLFCLIGRKMTQKRTPWWQRRVKLSINFYLFWRLGYPEFLKQVLDLIFLQISKPAGSISVCNAALTAWKMNIIYVWLWTAAIPWIFQIHFIELKHAWVLFIIKTASIFY